METVAKKFEVVKTKAENYYKTIGVVFCPYLKQNVGFNAKGLDHIKLKEWNKTRLTADQYMRLKLITLAPIVIKNSHTLQEINKKKSLERQNINSRWEKRMIDVYYYGFVAIINEARIKIIVKEVVGGQPYFWSIVPFWKQRSNPVTGEIKKIFHEGDLESQ